MPKRTSDFREDLLADLADPEEAAHYLNAALGDSEAMALVALRDVAEARQMAKVAKEAGVAREALYRMLSESGNPTFTNLAAILKSVGLKLLVAPIERETKPSVNAKGLKSCSPHKGKPAMHKGIGIDNVMRGDAGRLIVLEGGIARASRSGESDTSMGHDSQSAESEHVEIMEYAG